MPNNPNKLSQFWQELQRRKVIKVVAMYAATAFIIMEAADIMLPRLGLPDWTVTFLIILLIVGFPITIILSWVFDVTPEGIRKTAPAEEKSGEELTPHSSKRRLRASDIIIAVLLFVVCILLYPKIFKPDRFKDIRDEGGRISVAVMPFQNMTNDSSWDIWQIGIQNELITYLSNSAELAVRQFQTMNDILQGREEIHMASITPRLASDLSQRLQANSFIIGSIKTSGSAVRINAQVYNTHTMEIYKTFQIDGTSDNLFIITDSLTHQIRNFLEIRKLHEKIIPDFREWGSTNSIDALREYIQGINAFFKTDYAEAVTHLTKALEFDPEMGFARFQLIYAYGNQGKNEEAKKILKEALENIDREPQHLQLGLKYTESVYKKDPASCIKYLRHVIDFDSQNRGIIWQMGFEQTRIHQFKQAVGYFEKALQIEQQWESKFGWFPFYTRPAYAYHRMGNHSREHEILELGLLHTDDKHQILYHMAICAISRGDTAQGEKYIADYREFRESEGNKEMWIGLSMARIYERGGDTARALEIFNDLAQRNPRNGWLLYHLGRCLIEHKIDVEQGMNYIQEALKTAPDQMEYIYIMGVGLAKQGNLKEAKEWLTRAWDLRPEYDHDHYLLQKEVETLLSSGTPQ